jgi:hypothetical protein
LEHYQGLVRQAQREFTDAGRKWADAGSVRVMRSGATYYKADGKLWQGGVLQATR